MEPFTITTRVNRKEYMRAIRSLYRKPVWIWLIIVGIVSFSTSLIHFTGMGLPHLKQPFLLFCYGIWVLSTPFVTPLWIAKEYEGTPLFQEDLTYIFSEEGYTVQGSAVRMELLWSYIQKQKRVNEFLILYYTKRVGNFIDTRLLTPEQLAFIQSKVPKK